MNKLFTKVATLCVGLAMATGVGVAVSSASKDVKPVEAALTVSDISSTPASSVEDGAKYVIASGTSGNVYLAAKASNTWGTAVAIGSAYEFTAEGSGTTGFALKCKDGYLTPKTSSSNTFLAYGSTKVTCNLSSGAIVSNANTSYQLRQNGTSGYRWYSSSTGTAAKLYKINEATPVTGVSVAPTSVTLGVGATQQLTPTVSPSNATNKNVTYSSSANSIATVNTSGIITAVAAGSATITVTTEDGNKTATCAVTVTAPKTPASLATTGQTTSFETGDTFTYGGTSTVTYTDSTSKSVTPSSFKIGDAGINPISAGTVIVPGTTVLNRNDHHGKTVYVLYEENSTTVYASYTISVAAISKISFVGGTDTGTASGQGQSDTLTKSGISMSCDSCYTTSGAYRFYSGSTLTISSTVGNIAKIEFNMNGSYNSNLLSTSTGTYNHDDSTKGVWTGDAASIDFDLSAQARCNSIDITLASNDPLVELAPGSSSEVSMFKGDPDTSVKVLVKNIETKTWSFTFDEDEQEGITTSSYISVSAGAAVSDVHTLTITTKAVGSTVLHISVSGTVCATTIPVTVAAKPAVGTLVAKLNSTVVSSAVECITGSHVAFTFEAEDTDGNPYSVNAAALKLTITSGSSYGSAYGTTGINGVAEGTVVARFALKVLETVYVDVTVNVVDDYVETVGTPTFATGLTDTQGQSPTVSVFTSRPGTMHSGTSTTIPFENYKFSYTNSYATAEYGSVFTYDFSHGTIVDSTHKSQTIYVFCDIDEAAHGSYTVTVEQFNDPLTALTFTNVTHNAVNVTRGSTFQLEWAYTPENPTDGKEVVFRIDTNDDNISITVSESGLISIAASSNLGEALVVMESAHDSTIYDFVMVTAVLESMKYTVSETESLTPVSTVSSGDRVFMVATATDHSNATYEFSGYPGTYGGATVYDTNIAKLQLLIVEAGTESGTVAFKLSGGDNDGEYISYSGSSNTLNHTDTKSAAASWTIDGSTITNANTTARQIWMNWNNGTPRFACYTNKTDTTGYYCPTFIKVTGGDTEYDVTADLFNAVHNNFGEGKTYAWSESCPAFNEDAWVDACAAITDLSDYSSYKLNRAVANISGNEIEVFLAKYDNIITKFGTAHDWFGRFDEGGINHGSATKVNPLSLLTNNSGTEVAIIVVTSMIGLSAVGGYFFLRKRKENI